MRMRYAVDLEKVDIRVFRLFIKYRYSGAKNNRYLLRDTEVLEFEFKRWNALIDLHRSWRRLLRAICWQFGIIRVIRFFESKPIR